MSAQRKFLLEGCAFDPLLADDELLGRVVRASGGGFITLYVTALTYQDLHAIPDQSRRFALLAVVDRLAPELVGVPAVLVDTATKRSRGSYPGAICPVGDEAGSLLARLGVSERADARQAVAAWGAGACLVTDDLTLVRRARGEGIAVCTSDEFAAEVCTALAEFGPNDIPVVEGSAPMDAPRQ